MVWVFAVCTSPLAGELALSVLGRAVEGSVMFSPRLRA
jgi:hypothetical protein